MPTIRVPLLTCSPLSIDSMISYVDEEDCALDQSELESPYHAFVTEQAAGAFLYSVMHLICR